MPTTLTNGIQLPDKGSVDWYSSMQSNYNLIDTHLGDTDTHVTAEDKANWNSKQGSLSQAQLDAIAQVATNTSDIATLQSGKANASHTHSSSDITDIGDYATKQYVDNSISGLVDNAPAALDTLKELSTALNDDANFATTVTNALASKANSADLATVATSGSYNDLSNKPTINDSTITIQKNGSTVDTFTTNGSAKTINIPVPTKTSELTNDSGFLTSHQSLANYVTIDTAQDIEGNKNFQGLLTTTPSSSLWPSVLNTSDDITLLGRYVIHAEQISSGKLTDLSNGAWNVVELGAGCLFFRSNSGTDVRYKHLETGAINRILVVSGTNRFINDASPNQDNTYDLGSSSLRWRSINGLNPSSLGMPDLSNGIDISSYITVTDNANVQSTYTPPSNGWVCVKLSRTSGAFAVLLQQENICGYGRNIDLIDGTTMACSSIPVIKGVQVLINSALANGVVSAYFYPCQGNV